MGVIPSIFLIYREKQKDLKLFNVEFFCMSNPINLEDIDNKTWEKLKVLFAMMAIGHKSDREIAKSLGINNTTLSRRRRKLEQEGYIKQYSVMPDFHKLGFNIVVFGFASTPEPISPSHPAEFHALLEKYPEILCVLEDLGPTGNNWFTVSVHRSYDDWVKLYGEFQKESVLLKHRPSNVTLHTMMFHTNKSHPLPFSLRDFGSLFGQKRPLRT